MRPAQATWVQDHVLAPRQIPPADPECPCQGVSDACQHGEHTDCGHDQWIAWWGTEPETVIGSGFSTSPCRGSADLDRGQATVYLADRECHTRCNCHCHQPVPEPGQAPREIKQLALFTDTV
ncbi:hypothetical protein [Streptomyces sp. NPDC002343]